MLTRCSAKAVGVEPPPVHGVKKGIDPHKKPEYQQCSSCPPPGPPPRPSVQSAHGQNPIPSSRPCSRVQEVTRKILDRSKTLQQRSSPRPQPSLSPAAPAGHRESVVVPRAPASSQNPQGTLAPRFPLPIGCSPWSSLPTPDPDHNPEEILDINKYTKWHLQNPQGTLAPRFPLPIGHTPRLSLPTPDPDHNPKEILDVNKYTKRHLQNAQRPIPGIDLGEEEEILDPEVRAPNEEDFIKPPLLEELVDPTKIKQTFIPHQGELTKLLKQINTRIL